MLAHEPFSDRADSMAFARQHRGQLAGRRAALGPVTPEAWAAQTALEAGAHDEALSLVD